MKAPLLLFLALFTVSKAEDAGTQSLFNGEDLTGWVGEGFLVEEGHLVSGPDEGTISTVGTYSNYELDFDFQLTPGADSGIGIHNSGQEGLDEAIELEILDDSAEKWKDLEGAKLNGSVHGIVAAKKGALKGAGEWNSQRLTVNGSDITVDLNGEEILSTDLADLEKKHPEKPVLERRSGHISLSRNWRQSLFPKHPNP